MITIRSSLVLLPLLAFTSRGYDGPPWNPSALPAYACTERSFTFPSWNVSLVSGSGFSAITPRDSEEFVFSVTNRANGFSTNAVCSTGSDWSFCETNEETRVGLTHSFTAAARAAAPEGISIRIQESWVCTDRNETHPVPITFEGWGNATFPLTKNSFPVLVRASLQEPFPITPFYNEPELHLLNCFGRESPPLWTAKRITYVNSTLQMPWVGPNKGIGLQVDIYSEQTNVWAACGIQISRDPFNVPNETLSTTCSGGSQEGRPNPTSLSFDPNTLQLEVNQTWYCDEDQGRKPTSITGIARSPPINFTCITAPLTIGGGPAGPITGEVTTCSSPDILFGGKVTTQKALPPYALVDPVPTPWEGGCTQDSFLPAEPTFTVGYIALGLNNTSQGPNTTRTGQLDFNLRGPGGFYYSIANQINATMSADAPEAHTWYPCNIVYMYPRAPIYCAFQYDHFTERLTMDVTWSCDDKDPKRPILFNGHGGAVLKSLLNMGDCVIDDRGYLPCNYAGEESFGAHDVTWRMQK